MTMIPPMTRHRPLCHLDDIPDGGTRAFPSASAQEAGLFAVRRGEIVLIYVNACPHLGVSLDWAPGAFLSSDGSHIVCAMHGAQFDIETGRCFAGPCHGEHLEKLPHVIEEGVIAVSVESGV